MKDSDIIRLFEAKFSQFEERNRRIEDRLDRLPEIMEEVQHSAQVINQMQQLMDTSLIFESTLSEASRSYLLMLNLAARKKVQSLTASEIEKQFIKSLQELLFQSLVESNMAYLNQEEASPEAFQWALEVGSAATKQAREVDYQLKMLTPEKKKRTSTPQRTSQSGLEEEQPQEDQTIQDMPMAEEATQAITLDNPDQCLTKAIVQEGPKEEKENETDAEDSLELELGIDDTIVASKRESQARRQTIRLSGSFGVPVLHEFGNSFMSSTPQVVLDTPDQHRQHHQAISGPSAGRFTVGKTAAINLNARKRLNLNELELSPVLQRLEAIESSDDDEDEVEETVVANSRRTSRISSTAAPSKTLEEETIVQNTSSTSSTLTTTTAAVGEPLNSQPRTGTSESVERKTRRRISFMARVEAKSRGELLDTSQSSFNISRADSNETLTERKARVQAELRAPNPGCSPAGLSPLVCAETETLLKGGRGRGSVGVATSIRASNRRLSSLDDAGGITSHQSRTQEEQNTLVMFENETITPGGKRRGLNTFRNRNGARRRATSSNRGNTRGGGNETTIVDQSMVFGASRLEDSSTSGLRRSQRLKKNLDYSQFL